MAEIEITLPTIQYGNVKVRATPEELGLSNVADADVLGTAVAIYLNLFQQGFKVGAAIDVSAPAGAPNQDPGRYAKEALNEGLGGVTEVENEESPTDQAGAPWDRKVDSKAKPWETGSTPPEAVVTAPAVLDSTW